MDWLNVGTRIIFLNFSFFVAILNRAKNQLFRNALLSSPGQADSEIQIF